MGLDWVVAKHRPRRGHERQYRALEKQLLGLPEDAAERAGLEQAFAQVSHSAWEELEAPRVGIDARATRWFKTHVWSRQQTEPFELALQKAHGQYVPELARHRDGLAGGSFLVSSLDYGAGIIDSCTDVVGGDLVAEAWVDHPAKEAAAYARRLAKALRSAKSPIELLRRRLAVAARKRPPGPRVASSGSSAIVPWAQARRHALHFDDQRGAVEGMVRWLKFWSGRGYGFKAWS